MSPPMPGMVGPDLAFDTEAEIERLCAWIREAAGRKLRRRGVVVGVSGGVDSAVCLSLCARALGPTKVQALLMPERDSDPEGTRRGRRLCDDQAVPWVLEDIAPAVAALGSYESRDAAVRRVFPDFGDGWRMKITVSGNPLAGDRLNTFDLTVESPVGEQTSKRMPLDVYLEVVAATNVKQRTRKLIEYRYAEGRNYAVIGTPNRLEFELGFFVRGGDGLADLKPIAHLYKSQVYRLAEALDVPEEIRSQPPSTDTYSLPQTQEEFYFAVPYQEMDRFLWAWNQDLSAAEASALLGVPESGVDRMYRDIEGKRRVGEAGLRPALVPGNLPASPLGEAPA